MEKLGLLLACLKKVIEKMSENGKKVTTEKIIRLVVNLKNSGRWAEVLVVERKLEDRGTLK